MLTKSIEEDEAVVFLKHILNGFNVFICLLRGCIKLGSCIEILKQRMFLLMMGFVK